FQFSFCSYLLSRLTVSIARLALNFIEEAHDLRDRGASPLLRHGKAHMSGTDFDLLVPGLVCPAGRRDPDNPVTPRPDCQRRHWRLLVRIGDWRIVNRMTGHPLVELPHVGVATPVAPDGRTQRHHRALPLRLRPRDLPRIKPPEAPPDEQD